MQEKQNVSTNTVLTTDPEEPLHQDGFRPPKRRQTFNPEMVQTLIRWLGLTSGSGAQAKAPLPQPEWWLPDLAATLDMPTMTL